MVVGGCRLPGNSSMEITDRVKRERAVADAILAERTVVMLTRRYPGTRPDHLDIVITELSAFARAMRRKAEKEN